MEDTITVRKLFWAWEDDKEEAWLRRMANHGFHLKSVGFSRYTFMTGEPADIIYRLDYKTTPDRDMGEYIELFEASGWEHVGKLMGWQYFRKAVDAGGLDEIHTEKETKMRRYLVIMGGLAAIFPSGLIVMMSMNAAAPPNLPDWLRVSLTIFFALMLIFYMVAMIRLAMRMQELRDL